MTKILKVLHAPYNCGNNPWELSRAERKLGIKSDLIVLNAGQFYKNFDQNLDIRIKNLSFLDELKRLKFLKWALKNYDVFHFNYGSSIWDYLGLNLLDLPIIKNAGKKIIFTFQGDDARQKDYFVRHFGWGPYPKSYSLLDKFYDTNKRRRIKKIDYYADAIFALNPDLMYVLPKKTKFLPYASVNISQTKSIIRKKKNPKIKIIHAPSDRTIKGTEEIIQVVKKLAYRFPLELVLIENMPHKQAIQCYQEADIVIDQLKIGWYGGFAVEAMAMGLPVVCFLRKKDLEKFVPFWREIPIVNADQEDLEEALIPLIENPNLRKKLGTKSRKFVETYHDPLKIAKQTVKIYNQLISLH
ncbi:hypothetical protein A2V71_03580 [Candidatus Berkelbacteria bacterium RBG_13_40_8]|uniref:Glycosyl transferase family 1 domain-containing protein n=1 Tax=Candidatus Berkelbacteria bacterium RBG_13_40_8 TaxID=1797467 RepID=A0A1F5DNB8_9BACT|nr:MAG: hypothetical protein A2V71_03580 [Candidatus Berkelbacteria bacterium RBG_13_40_8]